MTVQLYRFVASLLFAVMAVNAARAADTTVRVALLDMTAMMGGNYGAGMMGQGYGGGPGGGGSGMGPGMMGRGYGGGYGMGPGMMGPGMMGPGMMMRGMMSIRADKTSVPAGKVTLDVTNWSRSVVHEVLVVAVDSPDAPMPYDYAAERVIEDQIKSMGETEEMPPQASETIDLDLKPGTYLLICNLPYHYAAGMVLPIKVSSGG